MRIRGTSSLGRPTVLPAIMLLDALACSACSSLRQEPRRPTVGIASLCVLAQPRA